MDRLVRSNGYCLDGASTHGVPSVLRWPDVLCNGISGREENGNMFFFFFCDYQR